MIRPVRFGDTAFRVVLPQGVDRRAVLDMLRDVPGVVDVVVGEQHALATFDPGSPVSADEVEQATARAATAAARSRAPRSHTIAVRYDGEDLDEVARAAGLSHRDLVDLHTGAEYVVSLVGFMPGFAYLAGVDPRLRVPRRDSPRARVPALSVAIAGPYSGIYPYASPGGWRILGVARGFLPFDPAAGATLALGDTVRFVATES
jgi:UPF0271 protein